MRDVTRVVYPLLLAAADVAVGWLLFESVAPAVGLLLVSIGLLVLGSSTYGAVGDGLSSLSPRIPRALRRFVREQ